MKSETSKLYVGFAISDSMFPESCMISKEPLDAEDVRRILSQENYEVCANPSHKATFVALKEKYGISLETPEKAPLVFLNVGDEILIISVHGLPCLEGRHEYTKAEIFSSLFFFTIYEIMS